MMKQILNKLAVRNKIVTRQAGMTLLQLMLILISAGIIGTVIVDIIRYYTVS